jgi:hypothetical protein
MLRNIVTLHTVFIIQKLLKKENNKNPKSFDRPDHSPKIGTASLVQKRTLNLLI